VIIRSDLTEPVEIVYLKDGEMDGGRLEPGATRIFTFDLYHPGVTPRCIDTSTRLSDWQVP
jgi:hypothetical protein